MIRFYCLITILTVSIVFAAADSTENRSKQRLDLDISFVYNFNGFHSYGASAEITKGWQIWETRHTQGMFDCGILTGYQREAFSQTNAVLSGGLAYGAAHHLEGLLILGTSMYLPPSHRLLVGIDLFGGWTHVVMDGYFVNRKLNISGDYRGDKGVFTSGAIIELGYCLSDRISIVSKAVGPLPYVEAEVTSYFMASLGVSIKLK